MDLAVPKVMGILNLTPDSFSDGGKFSDETAGLKRVEVMLTEGAEIIDIGAQSTRPGADFLTAETEIQRLKNILPQIRKNFPETTISLDTFYGDVVRFGAEEGIDLVNDISGGTYDKHLWTAVAAAELPYILMHSNDSYQTMHAKFPAADILFDINFYFSEKVLQLQNLGIKDIILDPGFGFGKTAAQQYEMIGQANVFGFGRLPLLAGISRKSFIYKSLGKLPTKINTETQDLHLKLLSNGVKILRTHDVAETVKTVQDFLQN